MEKLEFDGERINRFFKGEYSEKDESYVDEVFCTNEKDEELKHHLLRQFYELLSEDDGDKMDLDQILYKIHYDINSKLSEIKESRFDIALKWVLRIACVIILPLIVCFAIYTSRENNLKKEAWVEIKAPAWTRTQFALPDGTIGWLNSNSSIKYNGNFIDDRNVILKGEAFFDVFKDEKRPFLVTTDEVNLKVLGTRFNIASYENENTVEVVLEEGLLIFNDKNMNNAYTMNTNDLITYDKTLKSYVSEVVEPNKYVSWKEGKLVFRNDSLDVIARKLERWYNVDVEIKGRLDADFRLRATFIDEDLEEVLSLLKSSFSMNYKIVNGNIKSDGTYIRKKVMITPKIA